MIRPPSHSAQAKKIRVVLAIESAALRQTYAAAIDHQPDMEVAGEAIDPISLLLEVRKTEADVVLLSWPNRDRVPAICSHLFAEYNELLVVGIGADGAAGCICQQRIFQDSLSPASGDGFLEAIRDRCDRHLAEPSRVS